MSAIAGVWNLDGHPLAPPTVDALEAGLDAADLVLGGRWVSDEVPLALVGRVQPFTPEDLHEQQPLVDRGRVVVSFARLDNRPELAAALGVADRPDLPDSRLLLAAYDRWGERCPEHLVGAFAFAVWDGPARHLFCARDHSGFHPLYVLHEPGRRFAFASEAWALLALPGAPRALDMDSVARSAVLFRPLRPGASMFEGIGLLRNAHTLTVDAASAPRERRYWDYSPDWDLRLPSDAAYQEAFREVFDRAVQSSLRSLKPVGAHLSGGLDSSAVVGVAARLLGATPLDAFGMVPAPEFAGTQDNPAYRVDDRDRMEAVAAMHPSVRLHLVTAADRTLLDGLDRLVGWLDAPLTNANRVWQEAITEDAAAMGIGVILTGDVGNRSISDDATFALAEHAVAGRWGRLLREAHALGRATDRSLARVLASRVARPLLKYRLGRPPSDEEALRMSPLHPAFYDASRLRPEVREEGLYPHHRSLSMRAIKRYLFQVQPYPYASLPSLAYRRRLGVEFRDPTADRRVLEFCLSIPTEQFARGGADRRLVREGLAGYLPESVRTRRDRGDQQPGWRRRLAAVQPALLERIDELGASDLVRSTLDLNRMRALADTIHPDRTPHDRSQYFFVIMWGIELGAGLLTLERRLADLDASS